ncbi:hypothetical protein BDW74DRAFT_178325 [Aspergillus multicolor]|uniref:uncharacterized protein n=1 Tax=Aspergillus multicolor TaxID=41759 RepID=UPI003CCE48D3
MNDFLLATSVLCSHLQIRAQTRETEAVPDSSSSDAGFPSVEPVDEDKIKNLLRTSQAIWRRQCNVSREARKAVVALEYVLRDSSAASIEAGTAETETGSMSAHPAPGTAIYHFPGLSLFTLDYELPGLRFGFGTGSALEEIGVPWPAFTADLNTQVEQWAGSTEPWARVELERVELSS